MSRSQAAYAPFDQALQQGFARDDTPGSMLRGCEAEGGVKVTT